MKRTNKLVLCLSSILTVALLITFGITSKGNDTHGKSDAIKKFYSSYENKDINLFNSSVVESLRIVNNEDIVYRNLFFEDLESFKVTNIAEDNETSITTYNGITYDKDNIAVFNINYEIKFKKGIYGTSEGNSFVRKVIVREDENSPWLVCGNLDGHGY